MTSLKTVITGKSLISASLDIDRILHFVLYDKTLQIYRELWVRKFYRHILSINQQISKRWGWVTPPHTPLGSSLIVCFLAYNWFYLMDPLFWIQALYLLFQHVRKFVLLYGFNHAICQVLTETNLVSTNYEIISYVMHCFF